MKKEITPDEMLVRMAGLCAGAEQCAADIRRKILNKGLSASQADNMISYLSAHGYLSDERYSKAFASDKVRFAGWGRVKIRMALKVKGFDDSVITAALQHIDSADYAEALDKALASKARSLCLDDVKDRQKLYRHLASRGFESSVIIPAIRRYMAALRQEDQSSES